MKNIFTFLCISCMLYSCSKSDILDDENEGVIYDAPNVRSYITYTSQNSVTLNGFIDHESVCFLKSDTYKVGFIFRTGDDGLVPNTTYYYSAFTKNGSTEETDWSSFTTSAIPCNYERDNYYSISGTWRDDPVAITEPNCCDEGNVGFRFGNCPNIF